MNETIAEIGGYTALAALLLALGLATLVAARTRHHYLAPRTDGRVLPRWGAFVVALVEVFAEPLHTLHTRRMDAVRRYSRTQADARAAAMLRHPSNFAARQAAMAAHPASARSNVVAFPGAS